MAHIKRVAEKGGLVAQGFRVPIEHLDRIKIPVIARVSIRGYDHFWSSGCTGRANLRRIGIRKRLVSPGILREDLVGADDRFRATR